MRIEALNSECLYSYGNKRARRPNTHSASFPISIPLWLPYLLPFLLTLSLSILRCSFPRSLPPSSASRLIYPLTFSFYSSPLLFSFFYHYPSFSSLSHVPRLPTTDSPYLLPLLLFPTTYQAILLVSHLSSSPTSPRFRPLLSFVFHPFPPAKLRLDVPFTTRFHPPRPVSSSLSDPFAPCPPLSRVAPGSRASLCAGIVRERERARLCAST